MWKHWNLRNNTSTRLILFKTSAGRLFGGGEVCHSDTHSGRASSITRRRVRSFTLLSGKFASRSLPSGRLSLNFFRGHFVPITCNFLAAWVAYPSRTVNGRCKREMSSFADSSGLTARPSAKKSAKPTMNMDSALALLRRELVRKSPLHWLATHSHTKVNNSGYLVYSSLVLVSISRDVIVQCLRSFLTWNRRIKRKYLIPRGRDKRCRDVCRDTVQGCGSAYTLFVGEVFGSWVNGETRKPQPSLQLVSFTGQLKLKPFQIAKEE